MKLWGGRFSGQRDPQFEKFSESFSLDQRFVLYDLRVNLAYVKALSEARVLKPREAGQLAAGLEALRRKVQRNPRWAQGQAAEDVHTWVEGELERIAGDVARKLRTGRSRNDLVATEMRLYVKDATLHLERALAGLLAALVSQARRHSHVVLPGYTHLQPAQPILFAHYLLAYFEMFCRDGSRLRDCRVRADELPMGAGALAGTTFAINRERLARELGFARVARNSLDVTSDRDPVAELLFACALCMVHLSRWAEDLIIYSSPGFGYVELADAYSTGSSLMPQKKNPDSLELIRGRSGILLGKLMAMLAVMKGLPLAYDRDLQEDKVAMFSGVDTTRGALEIAARVAATLRIRPERMKAMTQLGFLCRCARAGGEAGPTLRGRGQDVSGFIGGGSRAVRAGMGFQSARSGHIHGALRGPPQCDRRHRPQAGGAPDRPRRAANCGIAAQAQMRRVAPRFIGAAFPCP
ncbi:MAG: argininosuccinate lyase [Terriglobia bacterium]